MLLNGRKFAVDDWGTPKGAGRKVCRSLPNNLFLLSTMGKLNIAHHKSYHPYRADNIARVRKDEEEAKEKEAREEGRMMLAVSGSFAIGLFVRF